MKNYFIIFLKSGGIEFLIFFLLPVFLFFIIKLLEIIIKKNADCKKYLQSFLNFFLILTGITIAFATLLFFLSKINAWCPTDRIIWASNMCAKWDRQLFGINLPFWFQDKNNSLRWIFDFLSETLIYSYDMIILVFSITLLFSLMLNFSTFLKYIFTFTIIVALSLPIWYLIPALTPMDMYRDNLLAYSPSLDIQNSLNNYQPNEKLMNFFHELRKLSGKSSFGVSTFPSMHIGWSIVILYFCFKIWRPLLFFIVPYTLLNGLATVFTLQHYGVDVLAGIIVAIFAIHLSTLIHYVDTGKEITYYFRKEFLSFGNALKTGFTHLTGSRTYIGKF